jgi:glycosyltransferase involved in cell wall biosynthesis
MRSVRVTDAAPTAAYAAVVPESTLLIATPSCDVYGSDLQMLESVRAARGAGWRVVVTAPAGGPLADRLDALGAELRLLPAPVLRRADASLPGMAGLAVRAARALPGMVKVVRDVQPDVVLVNTITLPLWPVVVRAARRPLVVHVHEAEDKDPRIVRRVMALPLRLADVVLMNSRTTLESHCEVVPALRRRSIVVHNGVEAPPVPPRPRRREAPRRLAVVGRLTRRKGCDVALEATALLLGRGHDVVLELAGTAAPGGEDFVAVLQQRAAETDLKGRVELTGYTSPTWPVLDRAAVVMAPSLGESFGNAVVEAQLAARPVVATAVQGHLETVRHEETGLLVPPSNPEALADAVEQLLLDEEQADTLSQRARTVALASFTAERYREQVLRVLGSLVHAHR